MLPKRNKFLFSIIFLSLVIGCQSTGNSSRDSLRKSDLVGSGWQLTALTKEGSDVPIDHETAPTLEFREEQLGGSSGCNNYQVGWLLGRDGAFKLSGVIAQTRMSCLDEIMVIERHFIQLLEESRFISQEGDTLLIASQTGQLEFEKIK